MTTWILKTNDTETEFSEADAADRLVKRRVAKDVAAAVQMLRGSANSKAPIVIPANGGTAEQTLTAKPEPEAAAAVPEPPQEPEQPEPTRKGKRKAETETE